MKYGTREISEMLDIEVVQAWQQCLAADKKRLEASKHQKFDITNSKNVGSFPSPNPEYLKLKDALITEMNKRKLEIENAD